MKILFITLFSFFFAPVIWTGNFNEAQKESKSTHKLILINFSGSDWCGPCIRLRKEIFESTAFEDFAKNKLMLVRADFPRQKKNQPNKEQIALNDALAEKYNVDGKFPYTLLLNENGKILKTWDGFPNESSEAFVKEISLLAK